MAAKRTGDAGAIERRLLDLAFTTDVRITAPALAYFAPCTIEEAAQVLDDLAAKDRVRMEVEDDGTIVYLVPGRQQLASPPVERRLVRPSPAPTAASPLVAMLLTICVPGAGHLYAGRFAAALIWFFVVSAGYVLILPGLVLHLLSIGSAANAARRASPRVPLGLAAAA